MTRRRAARRNKSWEERHEMEGLTLGAVALAAGRRRCSAGAPRPRPRAKDIVINMAAPDWLPTRFMQEEFDRTYKAQERQQREAGDRLHPVAQLLSARRRLAVFGREEVPDDRHRQPVAGRLRRGRPLPQAEQIYRRRPRAAGDHRRPAPGAEGHLVELSLQVAPTTTASRRFPDNLRDVRIGRTCSATRPSGPISRSSSTRPCPATTTSGRTWTGSSGATSASSSPARRATSLATASRTTISTASPIRPARRYDFSSMQINAFIWEYGGDIWDETEHQAGDRRGEFPTRGEGVRAISRPAEIRAAGRQDRADGHLRRSKTFTCRARSPRWSTGSA